MERRFGKPRFDRNKSGGFGNRSSGFGDRGFRNERRDFPKPINEGDEYDVEINEVGTKGDGIARVKNFVIFVADTKEGEKCRIRITMVRPKFAVAEKISGKDIELKESEVKDKPLEEAGPEELQEEEVETLDED